MTPSFPTRRSSDLLSRRRRSAKFERGRHLADRGGAANRRHPLARKADDRQYCAQLRDQSRQADSRLSRTLSLQRRRGVERAALAAGADVAGGERHAGREPWLSLRLSQQRQLYPRLFAAVRYGANRDAADGGGGMSGDRKSVVEGKGVSVRVDIGGRGIRKKKK